MQLHRRLVEYGRRGPREILRGISRKVRRASIYVHAARHRTRLNEITFIGITGSAGKTTTKDLVDLILSGVAPCIATTASQNTQLYIAQTILSARPEHHYGIVEVAASGPDTMDYPLRLLRPSIGVLTVIGRDHYRAFKSIEGIANEKSKLIRMLPPDGTAILNIDDPMVRSIGEHSPCRIIWVGTGEGANIRLHKATSDWPEPLCMTIEYEGRTYRLRTQLHGKQLSLSVLSALGVAIAAGVDFEQAVAALANATPPEGRMQIIAEEDGVTFIRDDWKSPYWSLQEPLEFLKNARAERKIAILGTVSDFSGDSTMMYKRIARQTRDNADIAVFIGPHAHRPLRVRKPGDESIQGFSDIRDASAYLRKELRAGDLVLIKGSNKADHLVRLILDRSHPIRCWKTRCGESRFCGKCSQLYASQSHESSLSTSPGIAITTISKEATASPTPLVLIGLGNPGIQYGHTPHNAGYHYLDKISQSCESSWTTEPEGQVARACLNGAEVILLKPAAKMNNSGLVIRRFLEKINCDHTGCIIIHDDMDLVLGKIRYKCDGGDAGHKGVASVIHALGTGAFQRIRIGVRREGDQQKAKNSVLKKFSESDEKILDDAISKNLARIQETVLKVAS